MAREEKIARLTRSTLRRIVMTAGDSFYATFEAGTPDISTLDSIPVSWARAAEAEIIPELVDLYRSGALATLIAAGGETLLASGISSAGPTALDDWQTIVNYDALDYQATATNRLVGVGDSVWNDVRSKTVTGLESGWTNERMKTEIESLGPFSEYRADTIARTEANAAYNGGNYDGADALGEYGPVAKTWSAFIDRRTRASHAAANDQTVAFSEPFSVGGSSMDRPHDPLAPAEEVVNCRCRVLFLYDGDTDPSGRVWTSDRVRASPMEIDVLDEPFEPTPAAPRQTAPSAEVRATQPSDVRSTFSDGYARQDRVTTLQAQADELQTAMTVERKRLTDLGVREYYFEDSYREIEKQFRLIDDEVRELQYGHWSMNGETWGRDATGRFSGERWANAYLDDSVMTREQIKWIDKYRVDDDATLAMNKALRAGREPTAKVEALDAVAAAGEITQDSIMYRSAILPDEMLAALQQGASLTDEAFMSVSPDLSGARLYLMRAGDIEGNKVIFELMVPKGTRGFAADAGEWVMQRGSTIDVVATYVDDDGILRVIGRLTQ